MNKIFDTFLRRVIDIYDANFSIQQYILTYRGTKFPWISNDLKKFSTKKQKLYIKFLRTKTLEDEFKYKSYKSLFKKLRKKGKITYYSKFLQMYETDSMWSSQIVKEIIGKQKTKSNPHPPSPPPHPKKLKLIKPLDKIHNTLLKNSKNFFTFVGPKLVKKMRHWKTISKLFDISERRNAV